MSKTRTIWALMLCPLLSWSQMQDGECRDALAQAEIDFQSGKLEHVVSGLAGCSVDKNLSRPLMRGVLGLLAETYEFLDQPEDAERVYARLLSMDPFYRPRFGVPEMTNLHSRFAIYPLMTFSSHGGIHFLSRPMVSQRFSPPGVVEQRVDYGRDADDPLGWLAGMELGVRVFGSPIDLNVGYTVSSLSFRYNAGLESAFTALGEQQAASLTLRERHRWSQFSLGLSANLVKPRNVLNRALIPFVYAGFTMESLQGNSAKFIAPEIIFSDGSEMSAGEIPIRNLRTTWQSGLLLKGGIRWHIRRYFLHGTLHYHRQLRNLANDANRFSDEVLTSTYNYADDDFRLHSLGLTVGVGFYTFRLVSAK